MKINSEVIRWRNKWTIREIAGIYKKSEPLKVDIETNTTIEKWKYVTELGGRDLFKNKETEPRGKI